MIVPVLYIQNGKSSGSSDSGGISSKEGGGVFPKSDWSDWNF